MGRLALVEGVLVDAQHHWATQAETLLGFALGKLVVDALDGGAADVENPSESGDADAIVVLAIGVFAERFAAVAPGEDTGQRRDKAVMAIPASQPPGMDNQAGRFAKAIQVAHLLLIPALAVEASASTARAGARSRLGFNVDFKRLCGFGTQYLVAVDSNSIEQGGH